MSDVATLGPQIGQLLRLAHQRAARTFAEALAPLEIDGRLFGVLSAIARLGPATQAQLVTALDTDKSAMLRTVDDLEQRGFVERQPVPGDRRARIIALTDRGRRCLGEAEEIARSAAASMFGSLSTDELVALRDTLARFVDRDPPPAAQ
ncbi:MarR family transcriptional regulator [Couchioplanes caeruleus]|uniref:MarR family winged helix-turn-helix transcriptional regulator n=1 Tax=Couchioplanes caeruleus TaxID=56438 RepID=UPI0020BDD5C4|nr:MarR family transcriptional regulator [Couchioplanes caeruleus]UQU61755.1 MarR family transcriptional regulator [Couchioplanes caeruleus]